jgi:dTDP-4-amino-4,6-dideoxy-D-galactose acyltransferase
MYLLVDSGDAEAIRLAQRFGWRTVDLRVTLGAALADVAQGADGVRAAAADDISRLRELAKRSHRASRFYADGSFPREACDDLFAKWIERSVLDRDFAGVVLVALNEALDEALDEISEPLGYISCAIKDNGGQIGLIAVDEKARGQGFGQRLLAESARWFAAQGAERISVATQGSNIPALRMYEHFGLSIESMQIWFHWWRAA